MKLRDRMIYAGLVTSDLKRRHPKAHLREFYRDLLHVCDDHGRFEADPAILRAVLYAPILDRVSERDVLGYLQTLHVAGDIKLYTVRGRGYGKVTKWRQTRLKTLVADYPGEDGEAELPLSTADPPPPAPPRRKEGRKEVCERAREARSAHSTLTDEDWLAGLAAARPDIDVRGEFRKCSKRYPLGVGRHFFEQEWLRRAEPPVRMNGHAPEALDLPEPPNFADWHLKRYDHGPSKTWAQLDPTAREYYLRLMKESGSLP